MRMFSDVVDDQHGNIQPGIPITVKLNGVAATIYSDSGGLNPVNPVTTDPTGIITFYYNQSGIYTFWNGATQIGSRDLQDLSTTTGAALVGYDGGTLLDIADSAKPMASYTALRAYTGRATSIRITDINTGGVFVLVSTDTTSADDGGTIIVDASSRRWYRVFMGKASVKWFGAKGDGSADDTTALTACRAFVAANATRNKLIFPSGIYLYSVSPNWAIENAEIEAQGEVRLRYTGTGNAVILDAGTSATIYNVKMGRFIVEAPSSALDGVFVRSVHHSKLDFKVRGCGTNSAAFHVQFAVCTVFDRPTASTNEGPGGWYLGAKPKYGILLEVRNAGEKVQACTFINPVIEGVSGDGIVCDGAELDTFIGGTSEANTGWGLTLTANSSYISFNGIDVEANTAGGIQDSGTGNAFNGALNANSTVINAAAKNSTYRGGLYDAITDNGTGTILDAISYSLAGGALTGSGLRGKRAVLNLTSGKLDPDQPVGSLSATVSMATGVATAALTLPSTGNAMFAVVAYLPGAGAAASYGAYAVIYQDGATARIVSQTNAPNMTITLAGMNVQVTQSSGLTSNVYTAAKPI